ncbi:hypothetical protein BaRGS_00007007 [Batillaria attramentaria]|uniref:Uncharacterized protein n=1 Tax=Batillaria attramentaria TaxID=370345 RepID=A0ABD0LR02_9CAEN
MLTYTLILAALGWIGYCHGAGVEAQLDKGGSGDISEVLFQAVWGDYRASVRPLCGMYPATTTVTLALALRQVQQLNEPKQILSTNLWLRVTWTDCRLTWNPGQFANVSRLIVPYDQLWTPDLTLYDNAESGLTGLAGYRISVTSEGAVRQQVPVVVHSLCQLDVSHFPFDSQRCNLTFGSWAYNGHELDLTAATDAVDLTSYVIHGEWELVSLTGQRIEPVFDDVPYPQMMAALGFLLPPETNEKIGLEITVLLSLAVMQLVVLDMIPASSETLPLIGVYFMLAMIVVSLSCLTSVLVLAVYYPNRHGLLLPSWARTLLYSPVARALCMNSAVRKTPPCGHATDLSGWNLGLPQSGEDVHGDDSHELTAVYSPRQESVAFTDDLANLGCRPSLREMSAVSDIGSSEQIMQNTDRVARYTSENDHTGESPRQVLNQWDSANLAPTMSNDFQQLLDINRQILDCMKGGKTRGDGQEKNTHKMARREWELMAMLLDRIFLITFCILSLATFTYIYAAIA